MTATGTVQETPTEKQERRRARRYTLSLPANIRTPGQSLSAKSRDVSTSGAYLVFDSGDNLTPGTELDLTLILPREITSDEEVMVRAHGRTVRVDTFDADGSKSTGIAVVFESHHFVRSGATRR